MEYQSIGYSICLLVLLGDFLPHVVFFRDGTHRSSVHLFVQQFPQIFRVLEVIRLFLCRGPVVDAIISHDRHSEEHRFYQGWVRATRTVSVHVDGGVGAEDIEYVQIVYGIQQMYVGVRSILFLQFFCVFAMVPVADEDDRLITFGECLQGDVAIVLGFDTAYASRIVPFP